MQEQGEGKGSEEQEAKQAFDIEMQEKRAGWVEEEEKARNKQEELKMIADDQTQPEEKREEAQLELLREQLFAVKDYEDLYGETRKQLREKITSLKARIQSRQQ